MSQKVGRPCPPEPLCHGKEICHASHTPQWPTQGGGAVIRETSRRCERPLRRLPGRSWKSGTGCRTTADAWLGTSTRAMEIWNCKWLGTSCHHGSGDTSSHTSHLSTGASYTYCIHGTPPPLSPPLSYRRTRIRCPYSVSVGGGRGRGGAREFLHS